jgi:hypothetical protein
MRGGRPREILRTGTDNGYGRLGELRAEMEDVDVNGCSAVGVRGDE